MSNSGSSMATAHTGEQPDSCLQRLGEPGPLPEPQEAPPGPQEVSPTDFSRSCSGFDSIATAETKAAVTDATSPCGEQSFGDSRPHPHPRSHRVGRGPRMPMRESLGVEGVTIILGGVVGILGGLAFITFLWFGHGSQAEAANATWVWRQLALRGYMNQAVTLTSLVLCFAVGLQTTVCTSMIACLVLENRAVRKTQVASLSVLRAINDGPRRVVELLLKSRSATIFLHLEFWLVLLLGIVGAALQFVSTILLADVQDFTVVGDMQATQVRSLLPPNVTRDDVHNTLSLMAFYPGDTVFPIFSEAFQDNTSTSLDPHSLSDTGLKRKGLLPLGLSDSRTAVRHYQGNAMVLNTRVACMPPSLEGRITSQNWVASSGSEESVWAYGLVDGSMDYSRSLRAAGVDDLPGTDSRQQNVTYFECGIAGAPNGPETPDYQSTFCLVGGAGGSMRVVDDDSNDMESFWGTSDQPWAPKNPMYLVLSTTMSGNDWLGFPDDQPLPQGDAYGEWQSYEIAPGRFLNVSLCFPAFDVERHEVSMQTTDTALSEPAISWSVASPHYNTSNIRTYLGLDASHASPSKRGVMDLEILGPPVGDGATPTDGAYNETVGLFTPKALEMIMYYALTDEEELNNTFAACWDCTFNWSFLYGDWTILFADVIKYTGRPASMFEAYITMLAFSAYQVILTAGGTNETVQLASIKTTQSPLRCGTDGCPGYISAVILLAVHLLVVAATTSLYVRQARFSRCSSIWPAIAQLVSGELRDTLDGATEWSDGRVERMAKELNDNPWVRLERPADGEKVQIVSVGGRGGHVPLARPMPATTTSTKLGRV